MNSSDLIIYLFLVLLLIYIFNKINNNIDENFNDNIENYDNQSDFTNKKSRMNQHVNPPSVNQRVKPPCMQQHVKPPCMQQHVKPPCMQQHVNPPSVQYQQKNKKIGKYNGFDNSHQYNENDFKLGSTPIIGILKSDDTKTDFYFDEGEDLSELVPNKVKNCNLETFETVSHLKNKNCVIDKTEADADIYIRKRLLDGSNYRSPVNYSNDDLKKYRDTHFAFRNNIWQTSNDIDMVDKINDMYFSGDYDLTRNRKGTRISDLFDDLTKNESKITQPCISNVSTDKGIERILDQQSKKIKGHNGNMLSNESWVYNQEKTINGGNFYNNIKPNDDHNSLYQAL